MRGEDPPRPTDVECGGITLSDDMWDLIIKCWDKNPAHRPGMADVLLALGHLSQEVEFSPSQLSRSSSLTSTESDRTITQSSSDNEKYKLLDSELHLQLHSAACMGDLPLVHAILQEGIDLNFYGKPQSEDHIIF